MLSFWKTRNLFSITLLPLSYLYGLVSKVNIFLRGRKACQSNAYVISVGNINVGGTGKTPLTIEIANYLSANYKVAVIGHSYKAQIEDVEIVDNSYLTEQIGDEAKQMLQLLNKNVALVVGKSRLEAVKLLETKNIDIIILDDGYTATYIKRDLNIMVVDGKVQLGNKSVMPSGPLREPISGLKRADCMAVINRQRSLDFDFSKDVFYLRSKISYAKSLSTKSLYAFCGLGLPEKFYSSLNKEGLCVKETKDFADHYNYTNQDIETLIKQANAKNLQLVTTLKDMVKIAPQYHKHIELIMLDLELTKTFKQYLDSKINNK